MKKLFLALALVGFVATVNASTGGDEQGKKCSKDKKCCKAGDKKDGKSCAGAKEEKK